MTPRPATGRLDAMRLGIAHHLGWAVAVTADVDHEVVDRRRIELIEPDLPAAPIHHVGGPHEMHRAGAPIGDDELAELVDRVRTVVRRAARAALDALVTDLTEPITSISVRDWPEDLPDDVAVLRRPPFESRVDSYMYCELLAEDATARGWDVHRYDARTVVADAASLLGDRADEVLQGPRRRLGPPWTKDHRTALAATVVMT